MKIITGTVTDGQIVVEGRPFAAGERAVVLGHEENETFRLSAAEKSQLRESIAQADRGEFVDAEQLLAELDESN
jgi:hypothetical protein